MAAWSVQLIGSSAMQMTWSLLLHQSQVMHQRLPLLLAPKVILHCIYQRWFVSTQLDPRVPVIVTDDTCCFGIFLVLPC